MLRQATDILLEMWYLIRVTSPNRNLPAVEAGTETESSIYRIGASSISVAVYLQLHILLENKEAKVNFTPCEVKIAPLKPGLRQIKIRSLSSQYIGLEPVNL